MDRRVTPQVTSQLAKSISLTMAVETWFEARLHYQLAKLGIRVQPRAFKEVPGEDDREGGVTVLESYTCVSNGLMLFVSGRSRKSK